MSESPNLQMRKIFGGRGCRVALACAAAIAVALAGCGGSDSSSSGAGATTASSATADPQVAALVPAELRGKTLVVAAEAAYPPDEYFDEDGKTIIGMGPDLIKALGGVMGLDVRVQNASFDGILPGLASGKYDIGMSSFTDTKEREGTVDFVTYFSAGTSFFVKADGGPAIETLDDICGRTVAVDKGAVQVDDAQAQSDKCKAAGKPAVKLSIFPDQDAANLAVSSGRSEVGMVDSPVAVFQVRQTGGALKLSGQPYGTAPYGIALPKGSPLARPLLAALKALMADGTYARILHTWGLEQGAIDDPVINGAES
jgi:polar amino acid transport system substrate-binding protein